MGEILELNVRVGAGRERELALYLREQVTGVRWKILCGLAAELVALHEAVTGSTVVVVTGSAQADRVLRELRRDQPALDQPI